MAQYLMITYPNVLVPSLEKNQQLRKGNDAYMNEERPVKLRRFLDYCLASEAIKSDNLFEAFLNLDDRNEFLKIYNKTLKSQEPISGLKSMTSID